MKNTSIRVIAAVLALLMCGCTQETPVETTQPVVETTVQTVPAETVPETIPVTQPVTEPPAETVPPTEPEPEPVAELITDGVKVLVGGDDYAVALSDDSHYSKKYVYPSQKIEVESATPFSSLYIEWDKMPGNYSIIWDGGEVACGRYGFLHEYVRLPAEVTHVEFIFEIAEPHMLCDIEVLTAGTAPEGIQDWMPPCEEADILVFPTHSDDDVLFFGPLISYYAIERQLKVQTAFMVDHIVYPERGHERLNGLWEMGVRYYPILGSAPDTPISNFGEAMNFYAASNIEQWQVEQIRRFKPLVVVGHDLKGEYGNGGHKVNAYYLVKAIEDAANPEVYPELAEQYGLWDTPKFYLHLYEENEIVLDVETPLENDPQGRTTFEIAVKAFTFHVSQHRWHFRVQYGELRMYDCRPFGLYRTLVGYDEEADIMDNIDPAQWRNTDS